jgi:predicted TIM-barrel fold metal-dependent hydrolase
MERALAVVDADSHVYEPPSIWTKHLSKRERALTEDAFWHERGAHGTELTVVNGKAVRSLNRSALNRFACFRPGATVDSIAALDPNQPGDDTEGAADGAARLRDLDALGIDQQVVFPTLFAEHLPVVQSPHAAVVLARAYNDWVRELASVAPDRLHPVGILPLQSIPGALDEIERLADGGFHAVLFRPSFHDGRFLNHSDYNPVWDALSDAGLVACIHPSVGNTNPEFTSAGSFVERVAANLDIGYDVAPAIAPVQDNMSAVLALCYYGHREDRPGLKLALCHAGAAWFELALEKSETYLWLFPAGPVPVTLEPEELWLEQATLVVFDAWEDSVGIISDLYGRVGAWGSRYPHHDATTPDEAIAMLERHHVDATAVGQMMGGNAARVFGLPVPEPANA